MRTLILNDNKIVVIETISDLFPKLESLSLMNNLISDFNELSKLATCANLKRLFLLNNPVVQQPNYRLFVISRLPQLKVLDFEKVKQTERLESAKLFGSFSLEEQKIFLAKLTKKEKIKLLIEKTKGIDQLNRLELLLKSGELTDEVLDRRLMEYRLL